MDQADLFDLHDYVTANKSSHGESGWPWVWVLGLRYGLTFAVAHKVVDKQAYNIATQAAALQLECAVWSIGIIEHWLLCCSFCVSRYNMHFNILLSSVRQAQPSYGGISRFSMFGFGAFSSPCVIAAAILDHSNANIYANCRLYPNSCILCSYCWSTIDQSRIPRLPHLLPV